MNGVQCIAREEYERTRGLSAFSVTRPIVRRIRNQHATVYTFSDGNNDMQLQPDPADIKLAEQEMEGILSDGSYNDAAMKGDESK